MEQSSALPQPDWDDNGYPSEDEMMDLSPTNAADADHVASDEGDDGEHHDQLPSVEEVRANMYLDNPDDARRLSPSSSSSLSPSNRRDSGTRNGRTFPVRGVAIIATVLLVMVVAVVFSRGGKENTQREDDALEYLLYYNISNPVTLQAGSVKPSTSFLSSPQQKALEWIVHVDPLHVNIPELIPLDSLESEESSTATPFLQRYIAAVFAYALTTLGSHNANHKGYHAFWQNNLHFLSGSHECYWNSDWKRKDGSTLKMGFICDDDMQITDIILQTVDLHGPLPVEIFHLQKLKHLALDMNRISGDIPFLPKLTHLSMAYNQLEGMCLRSRSLLKAFLSISSTFAILSFVPSIPPNVGTLPYYLGLMSKLSYLRLSENMLQGTLDGKNLDKLKHAKILALDGNELAGNIQPIFSLTNLQELYLGYNSLSSQLSNESFRKQSNLRVLDCSNNRITGPLPDVLFNMSKLEVIDFHFNGLNGHINPLATGVERSLRYLNVAENFLEGGIPESIVELSQLTLLDVSTNRFGETLPPNLGKLSYLESLLLSENQEFGPQPIPDWLQQMTNLRHLSLQMTARTGTIPDWFSTLTNLELLDLDYNHIAGSIPSGFGDMANLKYCMLNRNWLSSTVPTELSSIPGLQILMVDNNDLTGEIQTCSNAESQIGVLIADCGNPLEGCPDCSSETVEVVCTCCTTCCYDTDERCNTQDWLTQVQNEWQRQYRSSQSEDYVFSSADETFQPL